MPSFPPQLPLALQAVYALQHQSPFIRTEMQSGRARQRRAFTSVPSSVSVSWIFTTDADCRLFEGWFRDDLGAKDGENWFDMPLQTPLGTFDYVCRFADMYDGPVLVGGDMWQISAKLEIRERPIVAPDWATILPGYLLLADIFDLAMNREWPMYTLPLLEIEGGDLLTTESGVPLALEF